MDEHTNDQIDTNLGISRRTVLRRGAVVGGSLVWAAPAVQSLSRTALAQTNGTPVEPPPDGDCCTADAFGLWVSIPLLGINQTLGVNGCVAEAEAAVIGDPVTAQVTAKAVCGSATSPTGGPCQAEASIAELDVVVLDTELLPAQFELHATVLTSQATATCDPCDVRGSSTIASLTVAASGIGHTVDVNALATACNFDVLGLLGLSSLGTVTFNRQQCGTDGTLTVDALYINVLDTIEVIAARSQARADGCPCTTCAS